MSELAQAVDDVLWGILSDFAAPDALRKEADDLLKERLTQKLDEIVAAFSGRTVLYSDLMDKLSTAISAAKGSSWRGELERVLKLASGEQKKGHDIDRLRVAKETAGDVAARPTDEAEKPPVVNPPGSAVSGLPPILSQPNTSDSRKFSDLDQEYLRFFHGMVIRPNREAEVLAFAQKAEKYRPRYEKVGLSLGIPWWFIAAIHILESGFNFNTHLHNGDPLTARTTHVPRGQPEQGQPPFTWEESAADALRAQRLDGLKDWSLARALYRWEVYNGMGYRSPRVPSPYLWSFSTIYERGKYAQDGVFSSALVSAQCGAAVLLRYLWKSGAVELVTEEAEDGLGSEVAIPAAPQRAPAAGAAPPAGSFQAFFLANATNVTQFSPDEFLVKGASHAANNLNTDPPPDLWPNVVPLAKVLDALRQRIGKPITLLSVYRSPAYNRAIGGARASQHMQFSAADFFVDDPTSKPADWAAILQDMRNNNLFKGGLHAYPTFVHVDTRGWNASWE